MSFLITALLPIVTPIASALFTKYIEKKISPNIIPAIEKIIEIEKITPDKKNTDKHRELLIFIKTTPPISKFIYDCGWSSVELDVVVMFIVLMAKKPLNKAESKEKWNDDDTMVVFDFLLLIGKKWFKVFKR